MAKKMTREEFAALVQKLEGAAGQDPVAYRRKVGMLAGLGYGFILLLLTGVVGLIALVVVFMASSRRIHSAEIKILLILGFFAFIILRSLWVRFEKPEGIPLSPTEAGPLFASINKLTDALGAPRFHHVLLVSNFNAAVAQHPKLGIFGWQSNYLLVGLPLMQSLSPEQFEAVLAHELGHLRGGHGKFGAWIYRVNKTWQQLLEQLSQEGGGAALLKGFFGWYAPHFAAYTFALRRADEYEADRCAAQITGSRTFADALCALPVKDHLLDEHYWKGVTQALKKDEDAPRNPFTRLVGFLKEGTLPEEDAEKALRDALKEETGTADTHPSLSDRLRALNQEPRLPEPPVETAAERFLGPHLPRLAATLDSLWWQSVTPMWRAAQEQTRQAKQHLADLNARAERGETLNEQELWQRADLAEDYDSEEAGLALFRELVSHPKLGLMAQFAVGRILIARDDPEGVALLEGVMQKEPQAASTALALLQGYHQRLGDAEAAKKLVTQRMRHADKMDDASEERSSIGNKKTRYLPHGLPAETVIALREKLAMHPDVDEAYLVCKEVIHFPEKPMHLLGVTLKGEWKRLNRDQDAAKLVSNLIESIEPVEMPGDSYVVVMAGETKWLHKAVKEVSASLIYTS